MSWPRGRRATLHNSRTPVFRTCRRGESQTSDVALSAVFRPTRGLWICNPLTPVRRRPVPVPQVGVVGSQRDPNSRSWCL